MIKIGKYHGIYTAAHTTSKNTSTLNCSLLTFTALHCTAPYTAFNCHVTTPPPECTPQHSTSLHFSALYNTTTHFSTPLHCSSPYSTTLDSIELHSFECFCSAFSSIAVYWHCTSLHCTVLSIALPHRCTFQYYSSLLSTALKFSPLHYTVLYSSALHFMSLRCTSTAIYYHSINCAWLYTALYSALTALPLHCTALSIHPTAHYCASLISTVINSTSLH